MRNLKKVLAVTLSAAMVMGMSVPVMAADTSDVIGANGDTGAATAPIYSLDVVKVVVPSTYEVAFNPGGLTVTTGTSTTSEDQILSRNFGIINRSSKAKVVTVGLNIADQNGDDSPIQFVGSAADVGSAAADEYAIYLEAVPANATEVQVGDTPAAADETTGADDLINVTMTEATGASVPLSAGDNELQFVLGKATYTPIGGSEVTLGSTSSNDVESNYEITGLAEDGKGITAFTLTGSMKNTAEWHTLSAGIKITPTYTMETIADDAVTGTTPSIKTGTGAVYENPIPQFKTGSAVGTIQYTTGTGDNMVKTIKSITMVSAGGKALDIYNALSGSWAAATEANGIITIDPKCISGFAKALPNDDDRDVTVTYTDQNEEEHIVVIKIKLR